MKYKKGQKLLCKKSLIIDGYGHIAFYKGMIYEILSVSDNGYYSFENEQRNDHSLTEDYLEEFFNTNRKLKLKRIMR